MVNADSFGIWIIHQGRALDLTRKELAKQAGYSVAIIRRLENNERGPSRQSAEILPNVMQIPANHWAAFLRMARVAGDTNLLRHYLDAVSPGVDESSAALETRLRNTLGAEQAAKLVQGAASKYPRITFAGFDPFTAFPCQKKIKRCSINWSFA